MMSFGFGLGNILFGFIALIVYIIVIGFIISVPILLILIYKKLNDIDNKLNKDN